jgi:prepilin-type N-terminal cleavage/methylation domain-containing protein
MDAAASPARRDDAGFGLIEVVISMVLLCVIALAFLPLVARATQAAASGSQLAAASRLVSEEMELVRTRSYTTCPPLGPEPLGTSPGEPLVGPRGVRLRTWTKFVGPCSAPGTVRYVVSVTADPAPSKVIASASTIVFVGAP